MPIAKTADDILGSFLKERSEIAIQKMLKYFNERKKYPLYDETFKAALGIDLDKQEYSILTNSHHPFWAKEPPPTTVRIQNLLVLHSLDEAARDPDFDLNCYDDLIRVPLDTDAYVVGSPAAELVAQQLFGYTHEPGAENERHNFQVSTGKIEYPIRWVFDRTKTYVPYLFFCPMHLLFVQL